VTLRPIEGIRTLLHGLRSQEDEHSGPKRGNGAYWGYKCEAKKESNRIRRENWKREIHIALADRSTVNHRD